jgi:uncharacterized protein
VTAEGPRLPYLAPIDAYGRGGFRFAGMSHRGSLLCLPSGIRAWPISSTAELDASALAPVFAEAKDIEFLMIGSGNTGWMPPEDLRWQLRDAHIVLEVMLTGAAVRTYNILLGEGRRLAAALIAVD